MQVRHKKTGLLRAFISFNVGVMLMLFVAGISLDSSAQTPEIPKSWAPYLAMAEKQKVEQLMLVITSGPGVTKAELHCLERNNNIWKPALPVMEASVGRKGIADPETKREGDGMSPFGIFPLFMAFGYEKTCSTRMPYQHMTEEDVWVDDPAAPDYNQLVRKAATKAKSFEYMRRKDDLYKLGLVVEYNTNPVVPGMGSAIFVHIWGRPFAVTAGCLALAEHDLEVVLDFLDPAKSPAIGFFRNDKL